MMTFDDAKKLLLGAHFEGARPCSFTLDGITEDREIAIDWEAKVHSGLWGYYRYIPEQEVWEGTFLIRPVIPEEVETAGPALAALQALGGPYAVTIGQDEVIEGLTLEEAVALVIRMCRPKPVFN